MKTLSGSRSSIFNSGILVITIDKRVHFDFGAVMPAAPGPEITAQLIAIDHVHVRLDDTLRAQRLETAFDQRGGHALAPRGRGDGEVLDVAAFAVVPDHQAADDSAVIERDKTEPRGLRSR